MKFGIDYGHNCPPDTGASGIRSEDVMTKDVGTRVIGKLTALGHQVITCTPKSADSVTDSLQQRCDAANNNNVDIYVSIHFNAFEGQANGTEVFAVSDTGAKIAQPVLDSIVALGYFNRGIKDGSHLYVLKNTDMPSILIECAFCDNKKDMDRYDPEAMANAIVKGLTGKTAPAQNSTTPSKPSGGNTKPPQNINPLKVQQALNKLQIRDSNGKALVEDGKAGLATTSAIKKFQSIVNIQQTGIAGNDTWGAINEILAKPILRPNHASGPSVRYLQNRLGIKVDGVYGPGTVSVIQQYQSKNGLTADGIIGPQSWTKLIG